MRFDECVCRLTNGGGHKEFSLDCGDCKDNISLNGNGELYAIRVSNCGVVFSLELGEINVFSNDWKEVIKPLTFNEAKEAIKMDSILVFRNEDNSIKMYYNANIDNIFLESSYDKNSIDLYENWYVSKSEVE